MRWPLNPSAYVLHKRYLGQRETPARPVRDRAGPADARPAALAPPLRCPPSINARVTDRRADSRRSPTGPPQVVEAGAVPLLVLCVQEPELALKARAPSLLSTSP